MVENEHDTTLDAEHSASEHGHDEGPSGAAAVEPDSPPIRMLIITVVVLGIAVIGSGIGLAQYLGASTRSQQADKVGNVAATYTTQKESDAAKLAAFGYDAESKYYSVPLAEAKAFLVQNPAKVGSKAMWGLEPLTKPEPEERK